MLNMKIENSTYSLYPIMYYIDRTSVFVSFHLKHTNTRRRRVEQKIITNNSNFNFFYILLLIFIECVYNGI